MTELAPIVIHARQGDNNAFEELARRFQDMAVGYAYALLGDWQEAEDAAQGRLHQRLLQPDQPA